VFVPAAPFTMIRCPVAIRAVASGTPTTAGMPYSRATTAPCEFAPPISITRPPAVSPARVGGFGRLVGVRPLLPRLLQRVESLHVEAFILPEPVEGLDKAILHRRFSRRIPNSPIRAFSVLFYETGACVNMSNSQAEPLYRMQRDFSGGGSQRFRKSLAALQIGWFGPLVDTDLAVHHCFEVQRIVSL